MNRGQFDQKVAFMAPAMVTDDYGGSVPDPDPNAEPQLLAEGWARVRFGNAQEKREAAQEGATQTATFELMPSAALRAVPMTAVIDFDSSDWDITEKAPLERNLIRFTATRSR